MAEISDVDLKLYSKAIKEIGNVALKHADNNPAGAQFLLELTARIHEQTAKKAGENVDSVPLIELRAMVKFKQCGSKNVYTLKSGTTVCNTCGYREEES